MSATTIKMGKRGTLVIPMKLRKQFGMKDGSVMNVEADVTGLHIRPAAVYEVEIYTPERKAEFYLNNALCKEDWDNAAAEVREMGLDPLTVPNTDPDYRDKLPTAVEMRAMFNSIKVSGLAQKSA